MQLDKLRLEVADQELLTEEDFIRYKANKERKVVRQQFRR